MSEQSIELAKSPGYDTDGTWMVYVCGQLAGTIRPCWPGTYSARPHWQGYAHSMRVGKPCKTRRDAAVHVLDAHERRKARR